MRTTFTSMFRESDLAVQRTTADMLARQREVSTGHRITKPSDDPSASSFVIVESGAVAQTERFESSGDSAEARLTVMDGVLDDILKKLTSAQVSILSTRGVNGTTATRNAASLELAGLRDSVLEDLNTSFQGTYVFGGAAGTTVPYTKTGPGTVGAYAGSTRTVQAEIDRGRFVTIAGDGSAIARGTDAQDVFAVFADAITAVQAGDEAGISAAVAGLARAFDRTTAAQSSVGGDLRSIGEQRVHLAGARLASETEIAKLRDADLAESITGMQRAEQAYQAALGVAARGTQLSLFDYLR
jgi:flagellar hook-associated protein 3 FlgL